MEILKLVKIGVDISPSGSDSDLELISSIPNPMDANNEDDNGMYISE